jgi:hypothetical protein
VRDVFKRALKGFKPGAPMDAARINRHVDKLSEEAKRLIETAMDNLSLEERAAAADLKTSSQRAAVLLLDRLLTTPTTTEFDAFLAASQRAGHREPSTGYFRAEHALVAGSILRDLGTGGEVSWHRRAVRTAYAAMQASQRYSTIRDDKTTY